MSSAVCFSLEHGFSTSLLQEFSGFGKATKNSAKKLHFFCLLLYSSHVVSICCWLCCLLLMNFSHFMLHLVWHTIGKQGREDAQLDIDGRWFVSPPLCCTLVPGLSSLSPEVARRCIPKELIQYFLKSLFPFFCIHSFHISRNRKSCNLQVVIHFFACWPVFPPLS